VNTDPCHHPTQSYITWKWSHFKGRQDNEKKFKDLDSWAKANYGVDKLAKHYMQQYPKQLITMDSKILGVDWQSW